MKKSILTFALAIFSICAFSQVIGIKLANPKTFTIVPAIAVTTDSIYVSNFVDNGVSVQCDVLFYQPNVVISQKILHLIVWEGAAYIANEGYTKTQLKARIKTILQGL